MGDRPNIVLIVADDLGWGDLGCYGATRIPTPHVDAVARAGARFTDCHAASAVCTPSRYALLTGRYAWRSPLKSRVLSGHSPPLIEHGRPTVATVLASAGYRTAAIGKWHLGLGWRRRDGSVLDAFRPGLSGDELRRMDDYGDDVDYRQPFRGGPLAHGFDEFFGVAGSLDMPPYAFLRDDHLARPLAGPKTELYPPQRPGQCSDDWDDLTVDTRLAGAAVAFIDRVDGSQPFFLYVATSAPHRPCLPPADTAGRSGIGPRGDMVCVFDDVVGRVVAALDRTGLTDSTLLLITSDNGAVTGDDDSDEHRPNGPWRGQKADIWEGGHRVPLIARWLGRIAPGVVHSELIGLIDLLPTLAQLAGATVPLGAAEDAVDQSGLLGGAGTGTRADSVHHSVRGMFALRSGTWKAVIGTGSGGRSHPPGTPATADAPAGQLYDLEMDPVESVDRWDEEPQRVAAMYHILRDRCGAESGLPMDLPL